MTLVHSGQEASVPTCEADTLVLDIEGLSVWLVEDSVNGGLHIRQWANDGLEGGTHHLISKCLVEREMLRLRAALSFYAEDHGNPNDGPWGASSVDFGDRARAALRGER